MVKKLVHYFLLLVFSILLSLLPSPRIVNATGGGSAITTDIRYAITGQTTAMAGQKESYYVTNTLSGAVSTLYNPFTYVYLDKSIFSNPAASDITLASGATSVNILNDPNYYIIKINYSRLDTGYAAVPIKLTLKNASVQNGEVFNVPVKLFESGKNPATDTPLASSTSQFTAKTFPVGILYPNDAASATLATINIREEYVSDDETNAAHNRLSTSFVTSMSGDGYAGPANVNNGAVSLVPSGVGAGMDKRKVEFKIKLADNAVWDPSLPNNANWTYNSADHTITQQIDKGLATRIRPPFSVKWNGNQEVKLNDWTLAVFEQTTTLVNTDGTLDNSTRRYGQLHYRARYVRRIRIKKTLLGEGGSNVSRDSDLTYNYLVNVDQFGGTRPTSATSVKFRIIEDEPQMSSLLTGYGLRVRPERLSAADLAKLSHNKLQASNNRSNWTTLATDIVPISANSSEEYRENSIPTMLPTPASYRYYRLIFDDDITISQFDEEAVGLVVQTKLTPATHTAFINELNAHINDTHYKVVRNFGRVRNSNDEELGYSNADAYIRNPFANMRLISEGMSINGNSATSTISTGGSLTVVPRLQYWSVLWDARPAVNPKLVVVVDSDLIFDNAVSTHGTLTANYFDFNPNPTVIQNYKGNAGKTAYEFELTNLTFPGSKVAGYGNQINGVLDRIRVSFKAGAGLDAGPHQIKTILSWDNNTTFAASSAPGIIYSSDNVDFLDPYDANNNGITNDRLSTLTYNYTFVPPQAMVLGKKVKLSTDSVYQTSIKADKGDILDYQVRVWNNTNDPVENLHVMDVFPYANDKFIVKDGSGNYLDRDSKIYPKAISGVTANNSKFDIYYSTDAPSATIEGNIGATWLSAASITDWSAVTMFKADLKSGQNIAAGEEVLFNYKVEMPDTKDNLATDTANNSVSSWRGNNVDGANEFTDSKVGTHKYNIATHAFYDLNNNGTYDSTDLNIANRPYILVKLDATGNETVVESGTTDSNGNISFTNKLSNAGNYKLYVENLTSDSFAAPSVASSATVIGNDFTSFTTKASVIKANQTPIPNTPWSTVDISLTRDNPSAIKNLGLKTDFYNLTVKHIKDEDGSNLVADVVTREPRDTVYTTAAITTDPNFEVDTANLPANANGSYTADTTVTYHYLRKNAGDVTVHHYESGTTNELYAVSATATPAAEVLSGTRQMGNTYQTHRRDISTAGSYAIPHFHLVGTPTGPVSGTFDATQKTVTYLYERNDAADVTIKYIDMDTGANLNRPERLGSTTMTSNPTVLSGTKKEGLTWSSSVLPVDNYDFVSSTNPTNGVFGDGTTTVTYSYRRKNAGNITVHHYERGTTTELYVPTLGGAVAPEVIDGTRKLGLTYQSQDRAAQIPNYHLNQAPSPTLLTFTTAPIEIAYYYERDNGSPIIIHHIEDGTNNELYSQAPGGTPAAITIDGTNKLGLTYTTQSVTIPHFHLISSPANPIVTFGNTPVEVTYKYKRDDAGDVKVHHLELGTNSVLAPDENLPGTEKSGLTYSTSPQNIPYYTIVNATPTGHNGNYPAAGLTTDVTYYYQRDNAGNVIIHHYEVGTSNSLLPDEILSGTGKSGLTYITNSVTITNFTVVNATPANHTGVYPASGNTVVTYYYKRDDAGDVIVHHYEAGTTNQLSADETLSGAEKSGLNYNTAPANIVNFTVVNTTPANYTGTYTPGVNYTVTYEYRRDDAGDVTALYTDRDGNKLDSRVVLSGVNKLGLPYTTSQKNILNYILIAPPTNANGTFNIIPQIINYIYRRDDAGDVTIYHKSVHDNSDLMDPVVISGSERLGLPYTSSEENIANFEIDTLPSNAIGLFTHGSQSVTYLYRRKGAGDVTVNYVDVHGNSIESTDVISGANMLGLNYTTSPKAIPYYDLVLNPANANGVFTDAPITVEYIYKRQDAGNVIIEYLDDDGVPLVETTVLNGSEQIGVPYTTELKEFEYYDLISMPSNANGVFNPGTQRVTYIYRRKDAGDVIAHYINPAGIQLDVDEIQDGSRKLGLPYTTFEKEISGYHLVRVEGAESGVFTTGQIDANYVYVKNPGIIIYPDPIKVATPSQIADPHNRNNDYIIRPKATPSIATSSNSSRGGSDGNSSIRPTKTVVEKTEENKAGITNPEPQKPEIIIEDPKKVTIGTVSNRDPLPVPRTSDDMNLFKYMMLLISSCGAMLVVFRKR